MATTETHETWRLIGGTVYEAAFSSRMRKVLLDRVTLRQEKGQIVGIVGAGGAGKSTFIQVLTEDRPLSDGVLTGPSGTSQLITVTTLAKDTRTGESWVSHQLKARSVPKAKWGELTEKIEAYAGLGSRYHERLTHYRLVERLQLQLSVAIHLPLVSLGIDECWAHLSLPFQLKVSQGLRDLVAAGGTVWLVSDDLEVMGAQCDSLIWLDHGQLLCAGTCQDVLPRYRQACQAFADLPFEGQVQVSRQKEAEQWREPPASLVTFSHRKEAKASVQAVFPSEEEATSRLSRLRNRPPGRVRHVGPWLIGAVMVGGIILSSLFFLRFPTRGSQVLTVPMTSTQTEREANRPLSDSWVSRSSSPLEQGVDEAIAFSVQEDTSQPFGSQYRVKSADTLSEIAAKYHVSVSDLMTVNALTDALIYEGMALVLPETATDPQEMGRVPESPPTRPSTEASPFREEAIPTEVSSVHSVSSGDTLYAIATQYGVDVMAIQHLNGLQTPDLYPGQQLTIP